MILRPIATTLLLAATAVALERPTYTLPDALVAFNGRRITTAEEWRTIRRPELLAAFRDEVFGNAPIGRPADLVFTVSETQPGVQQVVASFSGPGGAGSFPFTIFLPPGTGRAPAVVLINHRKPGTEHDQMHEGYWSPQRLNARGWAAVLMNIDAIAPDLRATCATKVMAVFPAPDADKAWGAVGAWAWGASRVLDHLETHPRIDPARMTVVGQSRSARASLWAAAQDERFAACLVNNAGQWGTSPVAICQAKFGTVGKGFGPYDGGWKYSYWMCRNLYKLHGDSTANFKIDFHELIALTAPRLVYISTADKDPYTWVPADFLGGLHADPVWRLFGQVGLAATDMPAPDVVVHEGRIGYHNRAGEHDLTAVDWSRFLDFAERRLKQ